MGLMGSAEVAGGIFSCSHNQPEAGGPSGTNTAWPERGMGTEGAFTWCQSQENLGLDPSGKGSWKPLINQAAPAAQVRFLICIFVFLSDSPAGGRGQAWAQF